jgi:hypothetical protein
LGQGAVQGQGLWRQAETLDHRLWSLEQGQKVR